MEYQLFRLRDPEASARILAEMIGGDALPMPPLSNCWLVLSAGEEGLELHPDILNRHAAELDSSFSGDRKASVAAIGSTLSARQILAVAKKSGWNARRLSSVDGEIVEVAVEGRKLVAITASAESAPFEDVRQDRPHAQGARESESGHTPRN